MSAAAPYLAAAIVFAAAGTLAWLYRAARRAPVWHAEPAPGPLVRVIVCTHPTGRATARIDCREEEVWELVTLALADEGARIGKLEPFRARRSA